MSEPMSKIYLELLDPKRYKVFQKLSSFRKDGYLAGGTALALQINHRRSVDFDIFTPKEIAVGLFKRCQKIFGRDLEKLRDTESQLTFTTPEKINITFVFFPYETLFPLVKTRYFHIASFLDIATDKARTVGRRAVWRDYVDIFFLLKKKKVALPRLIRLTQRKFQAEFSENLFLEQLTYFNDLQITKTDFLQESYTEKEIKSFLEEEVRKYLKKVLK